MVGVRLEELRAKKSDNIDLASRPGGELSQCSEQEKPTFTEAKVHTRLHCLKSDGTLSEERHTLDKLPPAVDLKGWYAETVVKKLQSTSWEELRMVITPAVIALGPAAGGGYDDVIPLHELVSIHEGLEQRIQGGWSPLKNICMLFTVENGYNLGRKYFIAPDFPLQILEGGMGERIGGTGKHVGDGKINSCGDFVKWLRVLASNAKQRHQSQALSAKFARSRVYVRALFDWVPFQVVVGVILVVNFGSEVFKNQRQDMLVEDIGNRTPLSAKLDIVDTSFLVIFTTELFLNIYARWMRDFLSDGWCCFDALVIATSLITPFLPVSEDTQFPVQIFRLFRALRILRLFGRLKSVRVIINALSASLSPVANAFFIMFVVLMIYAILGVSLFAEKAPGTFGKFDRSVSTLFRIAGGDTWVDGMDVLDAESGTVNWAVGVYVFSFILIVNWTLLQVSVAVLLDNFVSETSREKDAANALIVEEKRIQYSIGNVLDPLLKMIAVEYIDHASLTSSLAEIFHFLLTSVGAQDELTCDDVIKGISKIDLGDDQQGDDSRSVHTTRIHMTKMDYDTITQQGALAKDNGALGAAEFDMVMRKQVHNYIQRKLQQSAHETETLQDFALVASLKALVMDVDAMKEKEIEMQRELSEQISASLSDLHHFIALLLTGDGLPFRQEWNENRKSVAEKESSSSSSPLLKMDGRLLQSARSVLEWFSEKKKMQDNALFSRLPSSLNGIEGERMSKNSVYTAATIPPASSLPKSHDSH